MCAKKVVKCDFCAVCGQRERQNCELEFLNALRLMRIASINSDSVVPVTQTFIIGLIIYSYFFVF